MNSNVNAERTKLLFLGTSAAVPDIDDDTASFLINDKYLVDTGWSIVHNLRTHGVDPLNIEYLFFTHLHHDHYLSLPSLFFYWLMKGKDLSALNIVGPAKEVSTVVDLSLQFLQSDSFSFTVNRPTLIGLTHGQSYEIDDFHISVHSTIHPVPGLCYRFFDKASRQVCSFTGDTAYYPPLADHVRGSQLLIHEASLGPIEANSSTNVALHSGAVDAARIAEAADVQQLLLVHGQRDLADACVNAAGQTFKGDVQWPCRGQTIWVD